MLMMLGIAVGGLVAGALVIYLLTSRLYSSRQDAEARLGMNRPQEGR